MTQKIFNAIDQINREGLDNSVWGLVDCYGTDTRSYFGTEGASLSLTRKFSISTSM